MCTRSRNDRSVYNKKFLDEQGFAALFAKQNFGEELLSQVVYTDCSLHGVAVGPHLPLKLYWAITESH